MGFVSFKDLDDDLKYHINCEFNKIYDKYKNLVYYVVIRIIGIPAIAEEITNDAFYILFKNMDVIEDSKKVKTYLTNTAKRLAYKHVNSYNEDKYYIIDNYNLADIPDNALNVNKELENIIIKFKNYLNPDELDLIIKIFCFDYTPSEVARENNEKIFTVLSKFRRTKAKLKKYYNEQKGWKL